ncbi:PREDICTED: SEC12-like protein 2 [Tarenaya hassleriana]|uniref:SEC12-like protein 2 n=1 Tax=Tarenaya hassleriana TaxID=28532 RepID=UPI00053C9186|nr:PREDICTED: SEC12-like protein 2 [Tarenaya hassleriana]
MANQGNPPANLQRYGVPFYATAWVPEDAVRSNISKDPEKSKDGESSSSSRDYVVLAGGGGEGHSGIPNAIIISHVDLAANSLSGRPVANHLTGSDLPYRMTVHPGGDGLICGLPNRCRVFKWEEILSSGDNDHDSEESERVVQELQDVGQQLALAFNRDGSVLATGGEDGTLRVFKWPSMKMILNESKAHSSVKDLTFSLSGKFLVSLGAPLCRVWDVSASAAVASLSKEKDEIFAFCRFFSRNGDDEVLYVAAMTDRGGSVITWDTTSWKRKGAKQITKDAISAFNVSPDGKLLALGTIEGNVWVVDSGSMRVKQVVKRAHLGLVTALTFSPDSRGLVSASMDSSARLTLVEEQMGEEHGNGWWVALFVVMLAVLVYFLKSRGFLL